MLAIADDDRAELAREHEPPTLLEQLRRQPLADRALTLRVLVADLAHEASNAPPSRVACAVLRIAANALRTAEGLLSKTHSVEVTEPSLARESAQ